jgi:dTDP-4-amino-4,6-dideoxygalactose transaminase
MTSKAAILGGTPVFSTPIPFAQPTLPAYGQVEGELRQMIESGMLTKGKFLEEYEKALEAALNVPHALGTANCTLGLYMLLKALDVKGEVIVPSFSFMATFNAVEMAGLTPVFADCEKDTLTLDPEKAEEAITPRTGAIIGVNMFGNPPDLDALSRLARQKGVRLIMDSAHSFGTLYHGRPMGGHGDGEAFSSSATKLLATGEGGAVTTRHREVWDYIKTFREYGNRGDYDCVMSGLNARLSEFHALLGLKLLGRLEDLAQARNRIADAYKDALQAVPGISFQQIREGCRSSYKDMAVLVEESRLGLGRDALGTALQKEGIPTRKYFHPPGHLMTAYSKYAPASPGTLTNTEYASCRTLMLPIFSHMDMGDVERIAQAIERIYNCRGEIAPLFAGKGEERSCARR